MHRSLIIALLLMGTPASASPSIQQLLSCKSDAHRLCSTYPLDQVSQIQACLEAHKPQLSKLCGELFVK